MIDKDFIRNITSKDIILSKHIIKNLIISTNTEQFQTLANNSDFIFPFLKERIIEDFVKLVNEENLDAIFEFAKIYSSDFEEIIIKSWLKFANESLTDRILDTFKNGTKEQKTYCALYFSHIKDTLALEYLNKEAFSSYKPLKINCAQTLSVFEDKKTLNKMLELVLNSKDEFETLEAFEFISAYGGENSIKFIARNISKNPFASTIIAALLDYNSFDSIKKALNSDEIVKIFNILIDSYPEDTSLDTIEFYQVYDYIKFIQDIKTQYAYNVLSLTKIKFEEFLNNESYLFDLDKNSKELLTKIVSHLQSLSLSYMKLDKELDEAKNTPYRFDCALSIIKEFNLADSSNKLVELINTNSLKPSYIAKSVSVLSQLNMADSVNELVIEQIQDSNIKALIESYLKK